MKKTILIILAIVLLLLAIVAVFFLTNNNDEEETEANRNYIESRDGERLYLDELREGDRLEIGSVVTGEVSGTWFFEAVFPVNILNRQGETIGNLIAEAQDEWMTEDLVPFSFEFNIEINEEEDVIIVFENANPSGLEEHEDSAEITVRAIPNSIQEMMSLEAYFPNSEMDSTEDCSKVFPLNREVPETLAVGRVALEQLVGGLTAQEETEGYFTSINEDVQILSLTVEDGIARADFSRELQDGVAGSCRVMNIRAQIEETLKQFPTVDEVVISIEGQTEDILQP
jgi:hypothetical protein